ncbi:MAG: sulfite exporter TauE/SafE family protein [Rhodocyclaceae bacterium]
MPLPELTPAMALLLACAGVLGGAFNALAGGGSLFTFPIFIAAGLPPQVANASNSVAVWPGHALAVLGYRRELAGDVRQLKVSALLALLGGATGAVLVKVIGNEAFSYAVPWLILFATLLFAGAQRLGRWADGLGNRATLDNPPLFARLMEFAIGVYGGFFPAGLGVILMAGLMLMGVHDLQRNNALKNLLASIATSTAVIVLCLSGLVSWPHTLVTFGGALVGGVAGTRLARVLPALWLRRIVIATGAVLSLYYFWRYYL